MYIILTGIIGFLIILKIWVKMTTGRCQSKRQMNGKTVVITGANTGIGKATALDLARRRARVILACRDSQRGNEAVDEIKRKIPNSDVVYKHLDMSKQRSIRQFAAEINRDESRLDVLVNNAGVGGFDPRRTTEDGVELTFAVNYFGPFLLTHLLLDKLKESTPSRIVNVSSILHSWGNIVVEDLNDESKYNPKNVYMDTKLALNMFTRLLSEKLAGTGVTVNSLHPGLINTAIFRGTPKFMMGFVPKFMMWFVRGSLWLFFKSPEEGAQTSIYLAVSEDVESVTGKYFADCQITPENSKVSDKETVIKLWELSKNITKLEV